MYIYIYAQTIMRYPEGWWFRQRACWKIIILAGVLTFIPLSMRYRTKILSKFDHPRPM